MQKSFSICLPQKISLPLPGNFYDCALFKQYTLENEEIVIFLDNPAPSLPIIGTKGRMGRWKEKWQSTHQAICYPYHACLAIC